MGFAFFGSLKSMAGYRDDLALMQINTTRLVGSLKIRIQPLSAFQAAFGFCWCSWLACSARLSSLKTQFGQFRLLIFILQMADADANQAIFVFAGHTLGKLLGSLNQGLRAGQGG